MKKSNLTRALLLLPVWALMLIGAVSCKRSLTKNDPKTVEEKMDLATNATAAATATHTWSVLFNGGSEGYHSYRIPSIVRTNAGTLLAFAEGRMDSPKDYGNINLVYKRS